MDGEEENGGEGRSFGGRAVVDFRWSCFLVTPRAIVPLLGQYSQVDFCKIGEDDFTKLTNLKSIFIRHAFLLQSTKSIPD